MTLSRAVDIIILIMLIGTLVAIGYLIGYNRGGDDLLQRVKEICFAIQYILV